MAEAAIRHKNPLAKCPRKKSFTSLLCLYRSWRQRSGRTACQPRLSTSERGGCDSALRTKGEGPNGDTKGTGRRSESEETWNLGTLDQIGGGPFTGGALNARRFLIVDIDLATSLTQRAPADRKQMPQRI